MSDRKSYTVRVYHSYYGCDTGCCGHVVEMDGESVGGFEFGHPDDNSDEARHAFARELAESKIPLECRDSIDWDSLDVSECRDC